MARTHNLMLQQYPSKDMFSHETHSSRHLLTVFRELDQSSTPPLLHSTHQCTSWGMRLFRPILDELSRLEDFYFPFPTLPHLALQFKTYIPTYPLSVLPSPVFFFFFLVVFFSFATTSLQQPPSSLAEGKDCPAIAKMKGPTPCNATAALAIVVGGRKGILPSSNVAVPSLVCVCPHQGEEGLGLVRDGASRDN